ncbi:MMPL family transporter [Nocardia stercoris]|uniref:MMPL family transporter n=1 Tax=Nocardia stercoris TaxID=2483361 RepID=A0A3M2L9K0_9NOCA|nr:MMPL family transporter [Nocardia stercoris]RMI33400.1 MMPL family transporter [Nocardia stercoris]
MTKPVAAQRGPARTVLAVILALFAAALTVGVLVPDARLAGGAADPAADSAVVARQIGGIAPQADPNLFVLVSAPGGVDDPRVAAAGKLLTERLGTVDGVVGTVSAWTVPLPALISQDRRSGLIIAHIQGDEGAQDRTLTAVRAGLPQVDPDIGVRIGGPAAVRAEVQSTIKTDLLLAELVAMPLVLLVLLWVFGGVVAAVLPVAVGVISIVITNALLLVLGHAVDVSVFSQNLTTAVGLGLAVDYALLLVRRFREEFRVRGDTESAVTATLATAGRTVLFSAVTITAVLAVLLLFPMYFVRSFAYAGVIVVVVSTTTVLVGLPAAFRLLGPRIVQGFRKSDPAERGYWAAWTRVVLRRPAVFAVATTVVLLCLAAPFASVKYGTVDDRQLPPGADIRATHDVLRTDFQAGALPIAYVVVPANSDPARIMALSAAIGRVDGVVAVNPPPLQADPRSGATPRPSALLVAAAKGIEPTSQRGQDVVSGVQRLARADGLQVGGGIATLLDTEAAIGRIGPLAVAIVALVAFAALFLLTESVVLAVVSVIVNGLSLTAALGAIVWIFQDGHLSGPLGFTSTGSIDSTLPILVVCIAFGLSMDYGVFVLARLTEERRSGADHRTAIVNAIQRTGGIITSAAIILAIVLIAIGASRVSATKMIGIGVALAATVDATVVRLILTPAVLGVLGSATWWSPEPLRRWAARLAVHDGAAAAPAVEVAEVSS